MKADLCVRTLENAVIAYPALKGAFIHSDRGTQYTSEAYRQAIREYHIRQSMNSAGGRCTTSAIGTIGGSALPTAAFLL